MKTSWVYTFLVSSVLLTRAELQQTYITHTKILVGHDS